MRVVVVMGVENWVSEMVLAIECVRYAFTPVSRVLISLLPSTPPAYHL